MGSKPNKKEGRFINLRISEAFCQKNFKRKKPRSGAPPKAFF
jgi:hypothetical protein